MLDERLTRSLDNLLDDIFRLRVTHASPDEVAQYFAAKAHVAGELQWMRIFANRLQKHLKGL